MSASSRNRSRAACGSRSAASSRARTAFACDPATGLVTFAAGHVPATGAAITAGFAFDVPVRFDIDELDIDLSAFEAGAIPQIPLVEIVP